MAMSLSTSIKWRESEDEVYISFRPEHAAVLCRAILKKAEVDLDIVERKVAAKDATASRNASVATGKSCVTVTATTP